MIEYEELRIRFHAIGRGRYLALANGPDTAAAVVRIDPNHEFRQSFHRLLDEELGRVERTQPTVRQRLREIGERLYRTMFPEPIAACLFESARRVERYDWRLRVRFELPSELADLPIEILRPPSPDRRLVGDSRFSLVHTVSSTKALAPTRLPTAESHPKRFRVLVVVGPEHGGPLPQLGAEAQAIKQAMRQGARPAAVAVDMLGWPSGGNRRSRATFSNLRAALDRHTDTPTAVVMLGHGIGDDGVRGGRVFLENPDGSPDPVTGERLAELFNAAPHVRLVVLNLCAGAASRTAAEPGSVVADELIAQGVPAVVAMQADVSDSAAARFTPTLLNALAENRSLDEAVAIARQDMVNAQDETTIEWATPVLLLHQQCRHTWLFKAVMVVGDDVPVDPLRAGLLAMAKVDNPPDGLVRIEPLVQAARFARILGNWDKVVHYADMGSDGHEPLDWLSREGRLESAADRCHMICELLANESSPGEARSILDDVRPDIPEQVFDCLDDEIQRVEKASVALEAARQAVESGDWEAVIAYCDEILATLPDGYGQTVALREQATDELDLAAGFRRAEQHREAENWLVAVSEYAAIIARRPDGYREAGDWEPYCRGRAAEAVRDLPAAIAAYFATGDFADAAGRVARCEAWLAEHAGDWRTAVARYEDAARCEVAVGLALPYAVGRLACADGDFVQAAKVLGDLPEPYRDARHWSRFADGKVSFAATSWDLVLDALHVLPPDFLPDEVSRMRGLARAHLAAARQDWQAVVEALQDIPDDDEVRVLRGTAVGYAAAERSDWSALVTAFESMPPPTAELADLWVYAQGRVAEAENLLADALTAYQGIPETMRAAADRRKLVKGKMAEQASDWPGAQRWFGAVPAGLEDAGLRYRYAVVREAFDHEDWSLVVAEVGKLGRFRDAIEIECYCRARIAESTMDWAAVAELFSRCPGFEDADDRLKYARGRVLAAECRWREALDCYLSLPDDHRDVPARRARLTDLLTSFGWVEGVRGANLAPDPSAVARADYPYRLLAPLGITPTSSMARIKDAELSAMRENKTAAIGVATLRSWKQRLTVDVDLYPIHDLARLRKALGALTEGDPTDLFPRLCHTAEADGPLLTLLHLGREQAINAWEERLRANPGDLAVAHRLAIAHRWAARDLDQAGAWEHARMSWQQCIGMWVAVLGDDEYWERWRQDRSASYEFMIPLAEMTGLRRRVVADLSAELHRVAEQHDEDGRPAMADSYRALGLAVQVEDLGQGVLAEAGGVHTPGGTRVVGGPVYLRTVRLSAGVGRLVADLMRSLESEQSEQDGLGPEPAGVATGELITRLRAAFSRLGAAQVSLEAGRPTRALALLPELPYTSLADVVTDPGCGCPDRPGDQCPSCDRFLEDDPAYVCLTSRDVQLWQDAVWIAVASRARIARDAVLSDDESGVDTATRAIGSAVEQATVVGLAGRSRRTVADLAGTCVETMTAQGNGRRPRLDRAVEFVERIRGELGLRGTELCRAHAEALYQRAYGRAQSGDADFGDYDQAIADLRLAIELSPTRLLMARAGLAHTLVLGTLDRPWLRGRVKAAAEALQKLAEGLRLAPGMGPLLGALDATVNLVQKLIYEALTEDELIALEPDPDRPQESASARAIRLAETAMRLEAAGNSRAALLMAVDAVQADPRHLFPLDTLTTSVTRWADRDPDGNAP